MTRYLITLAGIAAGCCAAPAQAHITLEQPSAPAGSLYKAVLKVGHGCDGSPTRALQVRLPAGFRGAKPVPKPGWTLTLRKGSLAQPYDSHGRRISEDVVDVQWTAQSPEAWLDDAFYDEFVLRGQLPDTPGPLWFAVRQLCAQGETDWAEQPASGTSTRGLKAPAALLQVLPAGGGAAAATSPAAAADPPAGPGSHGSHGAHGAHGADSTHSAHSTHSAPR